MPLWYIRLQQLGFFLPDYGSSAARPASAEYSSTSGRIYQDSSDKGDRRMSLRVIQPTHLLSDFWISSGFYICMRRHLGIILRFLWYWRLSELSWVLNISEDSTLHVFNLNSSILSFRILEFEFWEGLFFEKFFKDVEMKIGSSILLFHLCFYLNLCSIIFISQSLLEPITY